MSLDWILKGANLDRILDSGYLPQSIIRIGIRRQLAERIRDIATTSLSDAYSTKTKYINALRTRPMAIETGKAPHPHSLTPNISSADAARPKPAGSFNMVGLGTIPNVEAELSFEEHNRDVEGLEETRERSKNALSKVNGIIRAGCHNGGDNGIGQLAR